ncbi:c-type cytochrome [Pararhizobium haloflavum]|uniref:c-type cytochrome n=1 Tax=Pararhizobium haloflavum TaxID=2037914 RepID=UPI000C1969AE|nr:c-type cytochrome [Pararhizobium haloflavum]
MRIPLVIVFFAVSVALPAHADFRGHGGPVRALAIASDGETMLSGSFDTTAIVWDKAAGVADDVLRFHEDSVNAVAILDDGRKLTAGQDGRIALWDGDSPPVELGRHDAPVVAMALAPDEKAVATASWDGTVRVTPLEGDEPSRTLDGHEGNVNAVAFLPDGTLVSAGYDLTVRFWPPDGGSGPVVTLPAPQNALVATRDGEAIAAGADGVIRILAARGDIVAEIETVPVPVTALAISEDQATVASAAVDGSVWLIDRMSQGVRLTLQDADSPVWSLAFDPGDGTLYAGGGDRVIRQWNPRTGERLNEATGSEAGTGEDLGDSRGAEVFAACSACHTLGEDGGNRAGPSLHGIFGRPIASAPGYDYSPAFEKLDIVWTPKTVSELFEVGPNHYTPGTKMPEQRITNPEDRAALIEFLKQRTTQ